MGARHARRSRKARRCGVGTVVAAGLAVAMTTGASSPPSSDGTQEIFDVAPRVSVCDRPPAAPTGDYRFLSAPDFLNADIADLRRTPRWSPGKPNSTSPAWESSLRTVMGRFAAEQPDDVLVAGDLVNGHWGRDDRNTGVFGPVRTEAQQRAAVSRAARPYYRQWVQRFASRGLPTHVAVGDHELGDNPWSGKAHPDFKRRNLDLYKREFATNALRPGQYSMRPPGPANRTAYATYLASEVLLVTVDTFERTTSDVIPRLDRQQLAWLDRVLTRGSRNADWIIVQGHVPVAGPVRKASSSGLTYREGTRSAFWRTMARHDVDLYLNGEVHDNTVLRRNGITQISHGGRLGDVSRDGRGNQSYLVADVNGYRLDLTLRRFRPTSVSRTRLWQTIGPQSPPQSTTIAATPDCLGTMTLNAENTIDTSTGALRPQSTGTPR